jgi:hypothetical protein
MSFKTIMLVAFVAVCVLAIGFAVAQEEKEQLTTVKGVVTALAGEQAKTCPCTIKTADGVVYNVAPNDVGKKMAAEANGKTVEATGVVTEEAGAKSIDVKEYKVVEAAAAQ